MKPPLFAYHAPKTLAEALRLLREFGDGAKLLAGGQSLVPALNFRLAALQALIDLNDIAELAETYRRDDGALVVGAMTRHRYFETSEQVSAHWPLLQRGIQSVAHVQIRNRGTIGGSLCHADPSAEWPALCLACDAQMEIASVHGKRHCPAETFSRGVFTTAVESNEVLASIAFPAWPSARRWGFEEIARRRGDFAVVGMACVLDFDQGRCSNARVVAFGATDRAERVDSAEQALLGSACDARDIAAAASAARVSVATRSDNHASAAYRSELVQALTRRALEQAMNRQGANA